MRPLAIARALALAALIGSAGACADGTPASAKAAEPAAAQTPDPTPAPAPAVREATAPANGFGAAIAWRGLEEGLKEAEADNKALMLVVHASWCPKCKDLKPVFYDPALVAASERLVMVNVDQDLEPRSMMYSPDGTYIPRILFISPDGQVLDELKNAARPRFHYFYTPDDDLVGMMKQAAQRYGHS